MKVFLALIINWRVNKLKFCCVFISVRFLSTYVRFLGHVVAMFSYQASVAAFLCMSYSLHSM